MTRRITLGIHDGHDASACLLVDGAVVAAAQEERYSRTKNQSGYPRRAIESVLAIAGIGLDEVGTVAVAGRAVWPGIAPASAHTRESALRAHAADVDGPPRGAPVKEVLARATPLRSTRRLTQRRRRLAAYRAAFPHADVALVDHHRCHAVAAYVASGNQAGPVLVLTADGEGDDLAGSVSVARDGRLTRLAVIRKADSLGGPYESATYLLGMQPGEHEFKLMGLAPYAEGAPEARALRERLVALYDVAPSDEPLVWRRVAGAPSLQRPTRFLRDLFGRARFDHVAAAVQGVTEDVLERWVRSCVRTTGIGDVAVGGGVFMNVKANGRIAAMDEVDRLTVMPTSSDTTNAIGAAWAAELDAAHPVTFGLDTLHLGDAIGDDDVRAALDGSEFVVTWPDDPEAEVAKLLAAGEIVGRVAGRMEFGARALGNRSLLADPRRRGVVEQLNTAIKSRDFWMPFAPAAPAEDADRYLVRPARSEPVRAPFMTTAFAVRDGCAEVLAAALHPADHTARIQDVSAATSPAFHHLLRCFEAETGESVVLNTSLNIHGEPIARTPEDALDVLARSGLRHLQLGRAVVSKPGA